MGPASLDPGQVLGGRFAIVGLLGSGGSASVYLVVDQLRGERVALKVIHPHLSGDASVQRRLRREIAAATLLQHPHVLVPHEIHELDGLLCLTLPYHPGQTLAEHVASAGPLPLDAARALGRRVAGALAEAHRQGLLHRDVTANNVMVDDGREALLMDFGLARPEAATTRSTGMLGTTGYAAPELYAGDRADPRADLYGLGCVLYLAVTGELPFASATPMGTLQRQLAEGQRPVQALRPDCPDDLARLIDQLLRKDPDARPGSAGQVLLALDGAWDEPEPEALGGIGAPIAAHLEPGDYVVVVRERHDDQARRRALRVDAGKTRRTLEATVSARAQHLVTGLLTYVGLHDPDSDSPEQLLLRAIADEAQLPAGALRQSPALLQPRFVLIEGVSRNAARRIAADARTAGFNAKVDRASTGGDLLTRLRRAIDEGAVEGRTLATAAALALLGVVLLPALLLLLVPLLVLAPLIYLLLIAPRRSLDDLPVAYTPDLGPWLTERIRGRFTARADGRTAPAAPAQAAPATRGQRLLRKTTRQLDALETALGELDLPKIARDDLQQQATVLRERAAGLADTIDRLDVELAAPRADTSWVEPRLERLRTRLRAGEPVEPAELTRLEQLLAQAAATDGATEQLESRLTSATAGLLEIAATATAVRRSLLAEPDTSKTARLAAERLQAEARAARAAQAELRAQRQG